MLAHDIVTGIMYVCLSVCDMMVMEHYRKSHTVFRWVTISMTLKTFNNRNAPPYLIQLFPELAV